MTLRGKAAIVGIGEAPTRRRLESRTLYGLCAEAAREAIADAGLRKQDINGLVTDGGAAPAMMAEYIDIKPTFATGVSMQGASGASATTIVSFAVLGFGFAIVALSSDVHANDPDSGGKSESISREGGNLERAEGGPATEPCRWGVHRHVIAKKCFLGFCVVIYGSTHAHCV